VTNPAPRLRPDFRRFLLRAGLRPTRQRAALAEMLFKGDRHVTAEELHMEATAAGSRISLATVYNTLHHFQQAGLVRELAIEGSRTYFDTNTSNHNHFYFEDRHNVVDIPDNEIGLSNLPKPPEGYEIAHIDVVIRLVPTKRAATKA
jgi:Fur family iron response transcriptional regulator